MLESMVIVQLDEEVHWACLFWSIHRNVAEWVHCFSDKIDRQTDVVGQESYLINSWVPNTLVLPFTFSSSDLLSLK